MATKAKKANPTTKTVRARILLGPDLRELEFRREDAPPAESAKDAPVEMEFDIAIGRVTKTALQVELQVKLNGHEGITAKVAYRAILDLFDDIDGEANLDRELRILGARTAPSLIFPFIREAVASVSRKSDGKSVVLPIVNFAAVLDLESVEIPPLAETNPPSKPHARRTTRRS